VRKLEALFCGFIGVMALSFAWMFGETNPNGKAMAAGQFSILSCSIFFFLFCPSRASCTVRSPSFCIPSEKGELDCCTC
jgi:hypothetical protein